MVLCTLKHERDKMLALERSGGNYDRTMVISQASKTDLLWWKINIVHRHCKIKQYTFSVEFFSDASLTGWGAVCNGEHTGGSWLESEKQYHINYLELKTTGGFIKN